MSVKSPFLERLYKKELELTKRIFLQNGIETKATVRKHFINYSYQENIQHYFDDRGYAVMTFGFMPIKRLKGWPFYRSLYFYNREIEYLEETYPVGSKIDIIYHPRRPWIFYFDMEADEEKYKKWKPKWDKRQEEHKDRTIFYDRPKKK